MTRVKAVFESKSGSAMPLTVAVTLAALLMFCGISEYFRLLLIVQGVQDAVQSAVIVTLNDNYGNTYHGVREGYSGAYQPMAEDFEESLDYGDIYGRLDRILGLNPIEGSHVKLTAEGKTELRLWGLKVEMENTPIAPEDFHSKQLIVRAQVNLEVPVSFADTLLPPLKMVVRTSGGYTPIF